MKIIISFFLTLLLASCSIKIVSIYKDKLYDIDKECGAYVAKVLADTVLISKDGSCHGCSVSRSEETCILVYKKSGITRSLVFREYGQYPKEAILEKFDWNKIYSSIDSFKTQKRQVSYTASVIEGDTSWHQNYSESSADIYWSYYLITTKDTVVWDLSNTQEWQNPSMEKTKISKYIKSNTYDQINQSDLIYGERVLGKKKALIVTSK